MIEKVVSFTLKLDMSTLSTLLYLILFGFLWGFLSVFIVNIAGLPGALVAGKPGIRSKVKFRSGSIIASLGQTYIYLAYASFVISWSAIQINGGNANKYLVWIMTFLVIVIPVWKDFIRARIEDKQNNSSYSNPQVEGLHLTVPLVLLGFFTLAFAPILMKLLWGWVPYVTN